MNKLTYDPETIRKNASVNNEPQAIETILSDRSEAPMAPDVDEAGEPITPESLARRYVVKQSGFPQSMEDAAFHGIAGDIVNAIYPNSEASKEALLVQFLVGIGNIIGRNAYRKQAGRHHLNEFAAIVGNTGKGGRKGTSWRPIEDLFMHLDEEWSSGRIMNGIQSGEAIIYAVRDAREGYDAKKEETALIDPGVEDKRLLIMEEELARLLTVSGRNGNSISPNLREAWDGKRYLHNNGKHSPDQATDAHISLIGHITRSELLQTLKSTDRSNGLGNRILWIATQRSKKLALPKDIDWSAQRALVTTLQQVIGIFATPREIDFGRTGEATWTKFYDEMPDSDDSITSAMTARAEAHVLRLSMIYAVLDGGCVIEKEHVEAAIAVWEYAERSVRWIFGDGSGNRDADKILWALKTSPGGLTKTEIIEDVFQRNRTATDINQALAHLRDNKLADFRPELAASGKTVERWSALGYQN